MSHEQKESSGKVAIATISAVSTIVVALVSSPIWRPGFAQSPAPEPKEVWNIAGTVAGSQGDAEPLHAEVLLVPANAFFAMTDDEGRFAFEAVPEGTYLLFVRDATTRSAVRGTITANARASDGFARPDVPISYRYTVDR